MHADKSALLSLIVAACTAAAGFGAEKTNEPRVVKLFGGDKGLAALTAPTKVEAMRVTGIVPSKATPAIKAIDGYPILGDPVPVDSPSAQELAKLLSDTSSYDWDTAKLCEFMPGVAVRFVGKVATTEVLFCFDCDQIAVVVDGKHAGKEDTDPIRERLLAIIKPLFPSDAEIKAIPAIR